MLKIQKLIKESGWESLEELGISMKVYPEGIVKLDYSMIDSPKMNEYVIESRALILSYPDANIVAKSFDRFFNHGEALEITEKCNLNDAVFLEKVDGSLVMAYFCPQTNKWELSTRGMAFAEGQHRLGGTFRSYILNAMKFTEEQYQIFASNNLEITKTYIFEYIGNSNRIVTKYTSDMVVLIGVIDITTLEDYSLKKLVSISNKLSECGMNVRLPKVYNCSSEVDMKEAIECFSNLEEGFVVRDNSSGIRVKVKSPKYLVHHRIRGDGVLTENNIAELVVTKEDDEYLATFPEDANLFEKYQFAYEKMLCESEVLYHKTKLIEDQKEFALLVKDFKLSAILFNCKRHKTSIMVEWKKLDTNRKIKSLLLFV
jgi:hypothetical protein